MNHEIKDIIKLYNSILSERRVFTEQVDIFGIDELVYNPATKKGGDIGYGYDGGKKRSGITWDGHWGHLHVGFTDREVAIDVINQANDLGLTTTENLIAKKDRNGYVDPVHADYSFHYRLFPGEPKVSAGVDISGSHSKIVELMNSIIQKYGKDGGYSYGNPNFLSTDWKGMSKLVPIETKGKYRGRPIIDKNVAIAASIPGKFPEIFADISTETPSDIETQEPSNNFMNSTDMNFYKELLENLNAPVTFENMKFLLAWRQSEGQGGKYNPFNTTWELEGSTPMNSHGVQNYLSLEDGMEATLKTLKNGRYDCIVSGLKNNIGASAIASCPSLETWGTGDLVSKVVASYERGNPVKFKPLEGPETQFYLDDDNFLSAINEPDGIEGTEDEYTDPILKMMAQSIFRENEQKKKKFLKDVDRIKGLL